MKVIAVRLAATFVVGLGLAPPALAADMPIKAPPMPVVACDWCGVYVGINGGGSIGVDSYTITLSGFPLVLPGFANPFVNSNTQRGLPGAIFGGQVGFNWQSGPWVFGVEGDWDGATERNNLNNLGQNFSGAVPFGLTTSDVEKIKSIATVRGRIGWAHDGYLWYVTGGGAWAQIDDTYTLTSTLPIFTFGSPQVASFSTTKSGGTVGGGVETRLWGGCTAKAEYLYVNLGSFNHVIQTPTTAAGTSVTFTSNHTVQDHIIRLGLNYKFW
jgi:outer membrane immunogenic protein